MDLGSGFSRVVAWPFSDWGWIDFGLVGSDRDWFQWLFVVGFSKLVGQRAASVWPVVDDRRDGFSRLRFGFGCVVVGLRFVFGRVWLWGSVCSWVIVVWLGAIFGDGCHMWHGWVACWCPLGTHLSKCPPLFFSLFPDANYILDSPCLWRPHSVCHTWDFFLSFCHSPHLLVVLNIEKNFNFVLSICSVINFQLLRNLGILFPLCIVTPMASTKGVFWLQTWKIRVK